MSSETFGAEKPKDYDQQKAEAQANKEAVRKALNDSGDEDGKQPLNTNKSHIVPHSEERLTRQAEHVLLIASPSYGILLSW